MRDINKMSTILICLYFLFLRFIATFLLKGVVNTFFIIIFLIFFGFAVPLPFLGMRNGIIEGSTVNIILLGIAMLYFAFFIPKLLRSLKRK